MRLAKHLAAASAKLRRYTGGNLDVAVVLGSGLGATVRARFESREVAYGKLRAPLPRVEGHPGTAFVGTWAGKRVAVFAGRAHLYAGYSVADVTYLVRLAAAAGAKVVVLTNAAGGLNPKFVPGDLMLIKDHLNLTGVTQSSLRFEESVSSDGATPFVDMIDAYSERLRGLVRGLAIPVPLHEGVYAGVRGPNYETPAEAEALRRLGADAVGMSTVLETIAARRCNLEVLGLSMIANVTGLGPRVTHDAVLRTASDGVERLLDVVAFVIEAL